MVQSTGRSYTRRERGGTDSELRRRCQGWRRRSKEKETLSVKLSRKGAVSRTEKTLGETGALLSLLPFLEPQSDRSGRRHKWEGIGSLQSCA